MAEIDFTTTPLYAHNSSALNTGAAVTAGGASAAIGDAVGANGGHGHLRFDVNAIGLTIDYTVVESVLKVNASVANDPTCGFKLRASDFGAAIAVGDYNLADNYRAEDGPYRTTIYELISDDAVTLDEEFSLYIPSEYLNGDTNTVSSPYADFEIVPDVTGVPLATDKVTLHWVAAVTTAFRPRIVGRAVDNLALNEDPALQCIATGDEMVVGLGLQPYKGSYVKPSLLFGVTETNVEGAAGNLMSQAATRSRSKPGRSAPGGVGAGGSYTFELTPERWTKILLSFCEIYGTPSSAVIDGITYWTKVFRVRDACSVPYWTFFQQGGFQREVYPDVRIAGIAIRDAGLMEATVEVVGVVPFVYDIYAAGESDKYLLNSSAAYDAEANGLHSFMSVRLSFDNGELTGEDIENYGMSIAQDIGVQRGYSAERKASGTYAGGISAAMSFQMYFKNNNLMRKYLGVEHKDFPYAPEKKIITFAAIFKLVGELGETRQLFQVSMPRCSVVSLSKPVRTGSNIMLQCTAAAMDTASIGGSFEITVTDTYAASFYVADTEALTVYPREQ